MLVKLYPCAGGACCHQTWCAGCIGPDSRSACRGDGHLEPAFNRTLKDEILVPFPPEAPLSGGTKPELVSLSEERGWSGAHAPLHPLALSMLESSLSSEEGTL